MPDLSLQGLASFSTMPQQLSNNFSAPFLNAEKIQQGYLANKLAQLQNQYQPDIYKNQIENQQLQNQGLGIENQYKPDILKNQVLTGQLSNKYKPLDELISAQNSMNSLNRFGKSYQLKQSLDAMSPPARKLWISKNQEAYNQMLREIANSSVPLLSTDLVKQFIPQGLGSTNQYIPNGLAAPNNNPDLTPLPLSENQKQNIQNNVSQLSGNLSDQDNELIAQANLLSANKDLTTTKTRNQLEGAIQVEDVLNNPEIQQQVQDASNYAGALGKGKAGIAALSQSNPKAYENFISFQSQTMPLLLNRIKSLDAMGATDAQREELLGLYQKTMNSLTSNPKQFITQFNTLGKTLSTIADSVQRSASPLGTVNRLEGFKPVQDGSTTSQVTVSGPDGKNYQKVNGKWYQL